MKPLVHLALLASHLFYTPCISQIYQNLIDNPGFEQDDSGQYVSAANCLNPFGAINEGFAQERDSIENVIKKNAVYIELAGAGLLYSINYERNIPLKGSFYCDLSVGFQVGYLNHPIHFPVKAGMRCQINHRIGITCGVGYSMLYSPKYIREDKYQFLFGADSSGWYGGQPFVPQFASNYFGFIGAKFKLNQLFNIGLTTYMINIYPYRSMERSNWLPFGGVFLSIKF